MTDRPTGREYQRMVSGQMYAPTDPELKHWWHHARRVVFEGNSTPDPAVRREILRGLFRRAGETFTIEAGLHVDYGINIEIGERFYANANLVMLDVAPIVIGDDVMFGPHVQLLTATHLVDPVERVSGREFGRPITIGDRVWLGGGVIVGPGVTIGRDTVVGAGAVVTKDLPDGVVAVGVPARVVREV